MLFPTVLAPLPTPFDAGLLPDSARLVNLGRRLADRGVGLVPFGTTGEGPSLSFHEKRSLLDAMAKAELTGPSTIVGAGSCVADEVVALSHHAIRLGCGGVLLLPPFYFKGVTEDGLFAFFARAIDRILAAPQGERLRVYLYNFPRQSGVAVTASLVTRLARAYPAIIAGIKDSSGDLDTLLAVGRACPDLALLTGQARLLPALTQAVGARAGCISGYANLVDPTDAAGTDHIRAALAGRPATVAIKAALAILEDDPAWAIVRPPLAELDETAVAAIRTALRV